MQRPEIARDDNEHDYISKLEKYIDYLESRIVLRNALKRPVIIGKRDEFDEEETENTRENQSLKRIKTT